MHEDSSSPALLSSLDALASRRPNLAVLTVARGFPRLPLKGPLAAVALLVALGVGAVTWAERSGWLYVWVPALTPPPLTDGGAGTLLTVRDGDTVEVRYHDLALAVRLKNIDTAESVHGDARRNTAFGEETSRWAKSYLTGERVRVEFARKDWRIAEDHHGRALGFLWLDRDPPGAGPEDELYNETVIRQGFSRYVTTYGSAGPYHRRLQDAEAEARGARRGLWGR
jgi:endonuclease YncB( thermonuclease family)